MGIIEDSIFSVYKDAIVRGDMEQAQHAVDLVKKLREKIDIEGFIDPPLDQTEKTSISGTFFEPFPYRYYEEDSMVVMGGSAILLTKSENHLFKLLSKNETQGVTIKPITHTMIKRHLWNDKKVSSNALRLAIKRIRHKIEPETNPRILINHYSHGFLFLGKKI